MESVSANTSKPALRTMAALFFRLVNFTFGGGDPTMAAIQREVVERRKWLPPERYGLSYALARVTPGTNVLAFCAAIAWYLRGWRGAVVAVVAGTVPCSVLVVWLTWGYRQLNANVYAQAAIRGMLASAVGLMLAAAWTLIVPGLTRKSWLRTCALATGAAVLYARGWPPIEVLALAAAVGFAWPSPEAK